MDVQVNTQGGPCPISPCGPHWDVQIRNWGSLQTPQREADIFWTWFRAQRVGTVAPVLLMWSKPPPEVPSPLLSPHSECRQPDFSSYTKWRILHNDSKSLKSPLCGKHGMSPEGNDGESEIGNLMLPCRLEWQSCGKHYFSLLFSFILGLWWSLAHAKNGRRRINFIHH